MSDLFQILRKAQGQPAPLLRPCPDPPVELTKEDDDEQSGLRGQHEAFPPKLPEQHATTPPCAFWETPLGRSMDRPSATTLMPEIQHVQNSALGGDSVVTSDRENEEECVAHERDGGTTSSLIPAKRLGSPVSTDGELTKEARAPAAGVASSDSFEDESEVAPDIDGGESFSPLGVEFSELGHEHGREQLEIEEAEHHRGGGKHRDRERQERPGASENAERSLTTSPSIATPGYCSEKTIGQCGTSPEFFVRSAGTAPAQGTTVRAGREKNLSLGIPIPGNCGTEESFLRPDGLEDGEESAGGELEKPRSAGPYGEF